MAFKIVRNDITKMDTEAIVNTANDHTSVGTGCDLAVYREAGFDELLSYREEKIGDVPEGEVFLTPGFGLKARYIIHAVSPKYRGGNEGEEEKLRSCYRKSLQLAKQLGITSIAFPLISTGSFGYPKEEGLRIAVDEINAFLEGHEMRVFLVVFDEKAKDLGRSIYPGLEEYIDRNYAEQKSKEEYDRRFCMECIAGSAPATLRADRVDGPNRPDAAMLGASAPAGAAAGAAFSDAAAGGSKKKKGVLGGLFGSMGAGREKAHAEGALPEEDLLSSLRPGMYGRRTKRAEKTAKEAPEEEYDYGEAFFEECESAEFEDFHENRLEERMRHLSDTFSEYLLYLIREKNMENAEVYKRAIVDKKIFSKIKNNADYHPQKLTALCLCVGARLNLDESRDLLARAGYALSPCDKTDIIFSYFIENGIYDMIELDIQLEEHGLPCIIS
ncbi:MAG: macro domain-containing protein [Lachnospiraceae bacterium]|nr:macro domain-containing protein [Lachnospiraceae bacterium]